jgi:hypothetical protein
LLDLRKKGQIIKVWIFKQIQQEDFFFFFGVKFRNLVNIFAGKQKKEKIW